MDAISDGRIRRGSREYRYALVSLFCLGISAFSLLYAPQPLLHTIGGEFRVTASQSAWLMSATMTGLALCVLMWGQLSARIGERKIIIGGLFGSVALCLVFPLLHTWWALIVVRAVQGVTLAGPIAAALAWVGRHIEAAAIARVSGLYIAGTTVGGMSGRLLSGIMSETFTSWRIGVAAVALFATALGGIFHSTLPQSAGMRREASLSVRPDSPAQRRQRILAYAYGLIGMGMFVGIYTVLVYRVAEPPWRLGTSVTSMLFLSYLAGTLSSAKAGALVMRWGLRPVMLFGVVTMAVGVGLTIPTNIVTLWVGLFVLCSGFFGMHALSSGRAAGLHPYPGRGSGIYLMCYYVGSSLGGILFGHCWDIGRWPAVLALIAGCLIALAVIASAVRSEESALGSRKEKEK
ncbi:MFS transporter [Trueperella sp. LYQ143]|uniref:MFS transporter n=1 Tax=Trueperella sp. LYQ143 TaxID=3391059 RepID=UPI0039833684